MDFTWFENFQEVIISKQENEQSLSKDLVNNMNWLSVNIVPKWLITK